MNNEEKEIPNQSTDDNESPQVRNDGIAKENHAELTNCHAELDSASMENRSRNKFGMTNSQDQMTNLQIWMKKPIPNETSRRITSLRFLLIVLVVFIHNNFVEANIVKDALKNGYEPFAYANGFVGIWIQRFISNGIAQCAVPLFFMFSAYLQFMKNDKFSTLLKKRTKSLVIPYFLWPILNIGLYVGIKLALSKIVPQLFEKPGFVPQMEWTASDWFHAFFGFDDMQEGRTFGGFVGQMWFVRDLFILILLSPLLRLAVHKFPFCTLLSVSFFYFSDVRPFFVAAQALFYYTLGLYWADYDFDLFAFSDKIKWKAIIPIFVLSWIYRWNFGGEYSFSYWFMVFADCVVFLKLSALLVKNEKVLAATKYLAEFSFWLFAIHMPFLLTAIQTLWRKVLPMTNTLRCMAEYFGVSILVIAIGTLAGIILKKIFPPLFRVLNGGR